MTLAPMITTPVIAVLMIAGALNGQTVAYTGATLWDGTGAPPTSNSTIVVDDGRITAVGSNAQIPEGAEIVFLGGKYVIPGLINTHGHVSGLWAPDDVRDEADRIRGDLLLFARYGITTVNSLGDGTDVLAVRHEEPGDEARARLLAAGAVVAAGDPAAAREAAIANADAGADWLKLRVDDNLGTSRKMPWEAVQAVMDVGRERGLPVATHLFYLEDAKRLLEMGTSMVAHSVRDEPVDEEFINALRESGACYVPTLTREVSTFVYSTRPSFLDEPFFTEHAHEGQVEQVSDEGFMEAMAQSAAAAGYRVALVQALGNLKTLVDEGVPVAFGTDAGPAGRFPGFFEHLELSLMVGAGLTPEEALLSATGNAAACLGADDIGTLEPGNWADFLVLSEDATRDIEATRTLERVFIGGVEVP